MAWAGVAMTAPFLYGLNFHAEALRTHRQPNRLRFGATNDAAATAFQATVSGWMAAQNTSLSKRIGEHDTNTIHPTGTRNSVRVILDDGNQRFLRLKLRNLKNGVTDAHVAGLFLGTVPAGSGLTVLASPPSQMPIDPNFYPIVNADVQIVTLLG